jgi:hypothetical protein
MMRIYSHPARTQQGAVLLVSLIFLVVMGLIGLSSMQSSRLELRMAVNEEVRNTAHQSAHGLIDAIIATPSMTPVIGGIGFTLCTPGQPACNLQSLFMPVGPLVADVAAGHLFATATLTAPTNIPPPRGFGFSADKFAASVYQVAATYDRADEGMGRAVVKQCLIVLTPIN